jgi:hypothetical protein
VIAPCLKTGCPKAALLHLVVDSHPTKVHTFACEDHATDLEGLQADIVARYPDHPHLVKLSLVVAAGVS